MIAINNTSALGFLNDSVMRIDIERQPEVMKVIRARAASAVAAAATRSQTSAWLELHELLLVGQSQLDSPAYSFARESSSKAITKLANEWKKHLLDPRADHDPTTISSTVTPVFDALIQFGAGAVDLTDLPVDKVNGLHLSAILRATSRQKKTVPGWLEALSIARTALLRDGKNADKILAGLSR